MDRLLLWGNWLTDFEDRDTQTWFFTKFDSILHSLRKCIYIDTREQSTPDAGPEEEPSNVISRRTISPQYRNVSVLLFGCVVFVTGQIDGKPDHLSFHWLYTVPQLDLPATVSNDKGRRQEGDNLWCSSECHLRLAWLLQPASGKVN